MAPVMGRVVVEDGGEKCHCCCIRSDHMFDTPLRLHHGWIAVSGVRQGFNEVRRLTRIKCPALITFQSTKW